MLKKIFCIFSVVVIFFCCFKSYSFADSDVYKFWNNFPNTTNREFAGGVIDFGTLPTTINSEDNYMFYCTTNWTGGRVVYTPCFAVFRNATSNFTATYSLGTVALSGFAGCTIYTYSNNSYTVSYNGAVTSYSIINCAMLGYTRQSVMDATIPSIYYSNFDITDANDSTQVAFYGNIYNSSLTFESFNSLEVGGNGDREMLFTNYFGNYNPLYEPELLVFVGANATSSTFKGVVYLHDFRLNSGNYSVPYNRIFPENVSATTNVWLLLKITDNNDRFVYSFCYYKLSGAINISNFTPTEPTLPDIPEPTPTPGEYDEIINSQQQTTNAIQQQTQVIDQQTQSINQQTNAIQEQTQAQQDFSDNFYDDEPDIPSDIDVEDNVVNNTTDLTILFNNIRDALNRRDDSDKGFTFTLPNGDDFTINLPVRFIHNILTENEGLSNFINIFWQVVFGGYIIFDFKKIYNKFKNGDVEGAMNSSATDNVVKEALR